jgi:hypothetical protein
MAKAKIEAGNCGYTANIEAVADAEDQYKIKLKIDSDCRHIQKLAEDLDEVNALGEISFRRSSPTILEKGAQYCTHASCPVPVGIIKTVEVAAGLALPQVAKIEVEK